MWFNGISYYFYVNTNKCVCVEQHNQISDKKKKKLIDASFMKYPHISSKQLKYQVRGLKKLSMFCRQKA